MNPKLEKALDKGLDALYGFQIHPYTFAFSVFYFYVCSIVANYFLFNNSFFISILSGILFSVVIYPFINKEIAIMLSIEEGKSVLSFTVSNNDEDKASPVEDGKVFRVSPNTSSVDLHRIVSQMREYVNASVETENPVCLQFWLNDKGLYNVGKSGLVGQHLLPHNRKNFIEALEAVTDCEKRDLIRRSKEGFKLIKMEKHKEE